MEAVRQIRVLASSYYCHGFRTDFGCPHVILMYLLMANAVHHPLSALLHSQTHHPLCQSHWFMMELFHQKWNICDVFTNHCQNIKEADAQHIGSGFWMELGSG